MLEVGSTIQRIEVAAEESKGDQFITNSADKIISVGDQQQWFPTNLEKTLCFGCKRLAISAKNKDALIELLPAVVLANGQRTFESLS